MRVMFALVLTIFATGAIAGERLEVSLGVLSGREDVFAYEISVLKIALENSALPYSLRLVPLDMQQERAFLELKRPDRNFNVFFSGFSEEREAAFRQIDIPLTRGLLGYRVFFTPRSKSGILEKIRTGEEFKKAALVGSGLGWPDTKILKANGFIVDTSTYDNLWEMLVHGRIDAFNRGIHEAYAELSEEKPSRDQVEVNPRFVVSYQFDYFFYLNQEDERLATAIEKGLLRAYKNGDFLRNFYQNATIQQAISRLHDPSVQIIDAINPFMTSRQKRVPSQFWYNRKAASLDY